MSTKNNPAEKQGVKEFIISRTFSAPRHLVWKAWTEADRLKQWFGPKGFPMTNAKLDLRPGGSFHYCLRMPNGQDMWGRWIFREITAPERILMVSSFSDAQGGITRHPMSGEWPMELLTTTTLMENNGKTTVTIRWEPINATDAEIALFNKSHDSMNQGWGGTFEQFETYLSKA